MRALQLRALSKLLMYRKWLVTTCTGCTLTGSLQINKKPVPLLQKK